eukprot:1102738-Prorocentrum_minimum.AAC.2
MPTYRVLSNIELTPIGEGGSSGVVIGPALATTTTSIMPLTYGVLSRDGLMIGRLCVATVQVAEEKAVALHAALKAGAEAKAAAYAQFEAREKAAAEVARLESVMKSYKTEMRTAAEAVEHGREVTTLSNFRNRVFDGRRKKWFLGSNIHPVVLTDAYQPRWYREGKPAVEHPIAQEK